MSLAIDMHQNVLGVSSNCLGTIGRMSGDNSSKPLVLLNDGAKVRHAQPQIMCIITHANEA